MVTTPEKAKEKMKNKLENAIKNDKYRKGIAAFLGVNDTDIDDDLVAAWEDAVSDLDSLVDLWFENYKVAVLKSTGTTGATAGRRARRA